MDKYVDSIEEVLRERRALIDSEREKLENDINECQILEQVSRHIASCDARLETVTKDKENLAAQLEKERNLTRQLTDENATLKMRLDELGKMSGKVVAKTEHDDLQKVLRKYMNTSKRKGLRKRGYIKMVITEMAMIAKLTLPDDMLADLETFDDEEKTTTTTIDARSGSLVQICESGINNDYLLAE